MWALLRLNHQHQNRYCDYIQEQHPTIEIYYPRFKTRTRLAGRRHYTDVIRPVFPGYVFVNPDFARGEHRLLTDNIPFKTRFVKFDGGIEHIPDYVIEDLRTLEQAKFYDAYREETSPRYKPGQVVFVHHQSFDIRGVIAKILQTKITVDTPIGQMVAPIHSVSLVEQQI